MRKCAAPWKFAGPSLRELTLLGALLSRRGAFHDIAAALHRAQGLTALNFCFDEALEVLDEEHPIDPAGVAELGGCLASLPKLQRLGLVFRNAPSAEGVARAVRGALRRAPSLKELCIEGVTEWSAADAAEIGAGVAALPALRPLRWNNSDGPP
eukprot:gene23323-21828_t